MSIGPLCGCHKHEPKEGRSGSAVSRGYSSEPLYPNICSTREREPLGYLATDRIVPVRIDPDYRIARQRHLGDMLDRLRSCLLYTSPSPRDRTRSRMPSSAC